MSAFGAKRDEHQQQRHLETLESPSQMNISVADKLGCRWPLFIKLKKLTSLGVSRMVAARASLATSA